MKDKKVTFGRVFWPSLTASIIVLIIIALVIGTIIGGIVGDQPVYSVGDKAVLHMKLKGDLGETSKADLDAGSFQFVNKFGLADILFGLDKAAKDDRVKGLFIELDGANCGYATAREIRNAINKFEESGKFVVAYNSGEAVSLKQFYIASAADESYGFPSSMFQFLGLGAELMFYKGMFDKLDLEMQVVRGTDNHFKSAVEPYFLTEMSDSSRHQVQRYLNSLWEDVRNDIGVEKDISEKELNRIADSAMIRRVSDAVEHGLLDKALYRDEVMTIIAEKAGVDDPSSLNLKGFKEYAQKKFLNDQKIARGKKANVAVIVAEGAVMVEGEGLSSNKITKLFQEARKDSNIKTIVFRINSPGGSALASDEIWREVQMANEEKNVIVSMGDVAASGGYYIASPASTIFAEPTTITGSIGVFGVIPYTGAMLENKLGLSFDRVSTNKHAVLSTNQKLSEKEYAMVQEEVDFIYDQFLGRVAEGRDMTKEEVNTIARGRVWTGKDAHKIGLVDSLGGLEDAINFAVSEAGIKDPVVRYYPDVKKEPWVELVESLEDREKNEKQSSLPLDLQRIYERIKSLEDMVGIQARLPYEIVW